MRWQNMKRAGGYFTVEAALVLPIVFGCILFLIYQGIYQYDRCALEQNLNRVSLLALAENASDREKGLKNAQKLMTEQTDIFLAWEAEDLSFSVKKGRMKNEVRGRVEFPFKNLLFQDLDVYWEITARTEGDILNPVSFVRNYQKILGGLSDGDRVH